MHLVEIGPHPALKMPVLEILSELGIDRSISPYAESLIRGEDSVGSMLRLVGNMYLHHQTVSIGSVNSSTLGAMSMSKARFIPDLPTYAWNYGPLLHYEPRVSIEFKTRKYPRHDLLGALVPGGNKVDVLMEKHYSHRRCFLAR